MIKATKVDAVYDQDPKQDSQATPYSHLSFSDAINQRVGVIDRWHGADPVPRGQPDHCRGEPLAGRQPDTGSYRPVRRHHHFLKSEAIPRKSRLSPYFRHAAPTINDYNTRE